MLEQNILFFHLFQFFFNYIYSYFILFMKFVAYIQAVNALKVSTNTMVLYKLLNNKINN